MTDVHFNNIVITKIIITPDAREDDIACKHLAWMHEKECQEVKFAWCQFDGLPIICNNVRSSIKYDPTKCEDIRESVPIASQDGTHTRHQLLKCEWFGHIIVRPNIKSGNAVIDIVFCCKHNDRCIVFLPYLTRYFNAIETR